MKRLWRLALVLPCVLVGCSPKSMSNEPQRGLSGPPPWPVDGPPVVETEVYKTLGDVDLEMTIYKPANWRTGDRRGAIVFFFGGGWRAGSPSQFEHQCELLARQGMVAMAADYRVQSRHGVKVPSCVTDAKSAVRWTRANADRLGIDPDRIAAGGGSAGGHLAAATATLEGFDEEGEDAGVSARPNALVLFNPVVDLTPEGFYARRQRAVLYSDLAKRFGTDPVTLSPVKHVTKDTPPTIIFHGTRDRTVPYAQVVAFEKAMKDAGSRCELIGFEGQDHGFFNHGRDDNRYFHETMQHLERFLRDLGYLEKQS